MAVSSMITARPRIFSGMQPTGTLHIGNYLGALRNWTEIQYEFEPIFCVVDQHAITLYQDPKELREAIDRTAALYVAAGIDPQHCAVFVQSQIPGHVELSWIFTCVTPMGWLSRMTQFKAKTQSKKEESIGSGLFCYPVLMAADILLYQAQIVPVGEDQSQHLELTRDIAARFNSLYGETFVMPATRLPAVGARIMGLDDPTQKMSKSSTNPNHAVSMLEEPKRIQKLFARAVTDSKSGVDFDDMADGVRNLLNIYQAFSGDSNDAIRSEFEGMRYGDLKKRVAEITIAKLEPIQARYHELMDDRAELHHILELSAERIAPIAEETVKLAKQRTGLFEKTVR
ncbi:MAG: tryptophan--tRNA ligase [Bryobacterales bacterium]|nr:tryptophan--tRNA ligase [Bryobacterales bacterium]